MSTGLIVCATGIQCAAAVGSVFWGGRGNSRDTFGRSKRGERGGGGGETSTGFRARVLNPATAGQNRRTPRRGTRRTNPTDRGGNKIGRHPNGPSSVYEWKTSPSIRDVFRAYGRISTVTCVCHERRSDPVRNSNSSSVEFLSFRPHFVESEPGREPDEVAFTWGGNGRIGGTQNSCYLDMGCVQKFISPRAFWPRALRGISYRTNEYLQRVKHSRPEAISQVF